MVIINIANSLRGFFFWHSLSPEKLKTSTDSSSHFNLMMYIPEMPGLETTNQPQNKGKNKDNGNGNHIIPRLPPRRIRNVSMRDQSPSHRYNHHLSGHHWEEKQ
jgi:hypothetical protein